MVGQTRGYWCATTSNFDVDGLWSWCNGPGANSYMACYFPFLYKAELRTTCILDNSGSWCSISADYDRDGKGIYCLDGVKANTVSSASVQSGTVGGSLLETTTMTVAPSTQTPVPTVTTAQVLTHNASLKTAILYNTTALTSIPDTSVPPASTGLQNAASTVSTGGETTAIPGLKASTASSALLPSEATGGGLPEATTATVAPSTKTSVPAFSTKKILTQKSPLQTAIYANPTVLTSNSDTSVPPASTADTLPAGEVTTAISDLKFSTVSSATVQPGANGGGLLSTTILPTETATMATSPSTENPVSSTDTPAPHTATPVSSTETPVSSTETPVPTVNTSEPPESTGLQSVGDTVPAGGVTTAVQDFTSSNITNSTVWEQLTQWLDIISQNESMGTGMGIIPALQEYTFSAGSSGLHKEEVALIVYILGNITERTAQSNMTIPISMVLDILYITNQLLNESTWKPVASAYNSLGPQLLKSSESILEGMAMSHSSFNVSHENVEFYCVVAPCSNLTNQTALRLPHGSLALSAEDSQLDFDPSCLVNILLLSYRNLNVGFPDNYDQDLGEAKVDSNIQTNVMLLENKSYHNPNVKLNFQCNSRTCDQTAICAFWNFSTNSWSSDGCTTLVLDGVTNCFCQHLTSFSVLMAKFIPESLRNSLVLDYITTTGLAISIASLLLCIAFQVYVMKVPMNLVAYYRHTAILNVSIFLLLSNVSFIAASYVTPNRHIRLCVGLTFCTHFSLMAFFCWTSVQSIFLFCRLVFVFHHITKKEFMSLSIGLGYICPSVIAVGTFLYYTPTDEYIKDNLCWLSSDSGASMAFSVPTIVILSANFLVLLVVIRKLLRPSISEGNNEDEEVIKKLMKAILFCTPQFGLTWTIGIPLLSDGSSIALNYLFVLLNPLQGFFIFIFGCLLDKKVMNMIKKRISKTPAFSSTEEIQETGAGSTSKKSGKRMQFISGSTVVPRGEEGI
ncbi:adhesion G protein-coupled receptor F4-like [Mantella aurantiaca]